MATKKTANAANTAAQDAGTAVEQAAPGMETQAQEQVKETEAAEATEEAEKLVTGIMDVDAARVVTDPEAERLQAKAKTIMQGSNCKKVWRCPKKGYWFTRGEFAAAHAKKFDIVPEVYEWKD